MKRFTLRWLPALLLAAAPGVVGAAATGDYVAMSVPDMGQAVHFFHDVLNCVPLADSDDANAPSVLLDCGRGRIVELSRQTAAHRTTAPPLLLNTDDVASAAEWLRDRHIQIDAHPLGSRSTAGGLLAVDFDTPWGQSLRLVGYAPDDAIQRAASAARLVSE